VQHDQHRRGKYYGDDVLPSAGIDLSEGFDKFMARVQAHAKGSAVRNARKAKDCTTALFDYPSWNPDLHAIHYSKEVRSGGIMIGHYLDSIDEMEGGWPTELRAPQAPECPNHWKLSWGVFAPTPGEVWSTKLVGYINVERVGNVASYLQIMGHGDWLSKGVMFRLHFDLVKWAMTDPLFQGCEVLWYGNFGGSDGNAQWKSSAGFQEIFLR
jgi:hypothetical protein